MSAGIMSPHRILRVVHNIDVREGIRTYTLVENSHCFTSNGNAIHAYIVNDPMTKKLADTLLS
jgi:hypothetical protein